MHGTPFWMRGPQDLPFFRRRQNHRVAAAVAAGPDIRLRNAQHPDRSRSLSSIDTGQTAATSTDKTNRAPFNDQADIASGENHLLSRC